MWKYSGRERPSFAVEPIGQQESVWDYPRPPICVADAREVIVRSGDLLVAKTSKSIRVLETASPPTFYIPPADVNIEWLEHAAGSSFCEWKGAATYWSLLVDEQEIAHVAWSYESPAGQFSSIAKYFSFYPAKLKCFVNGLPVRPQLGDFYGGWITDDVVGPFKGETGTAGW